MSGSRSGLLPGMATLLRYGGMMLAAGLLGLAGFGCALAALWLFAAPWIGQAGAALCVAAALFTAAALIAWRMQPPAAPPIGIADVMAAVLAGLAAGRKAD